MGVQNVSSVKRVYHWDRNYTPNTKKSSDTTADEKTTVEEKFSFTKFTRKTNHYFNIFDLFSLFCRTINVTLQ